MVYKMSWRSGKTFGKWTWRILLAGIGAGVYESYEDAFKYAVKLKDAVDPDPSTYEVLEKKYKKWCKLNEIMMQYWDEPL